MSAGTGSPAIGWRTTTFALGGLAAAGFVALMPPSLESEAIWLLALLGIAGGANARAGREVLALVVGSVTGAALVAIATYGTTIGPTSMGSVAVGLAATGGLVGALAGSLFWLIRALGPADSGAETGAEPRLASLEHPAAGRRRSPWGPVGLLLVAGLALLAIAVGVAVSSAS